MQPTLGSTWRGRAAGVVFVAPALACWVAVVAIGSPAIAASPTCTADLDDNGLVGLEDLVAVIDAWGNEGGPEDLDGSGTVDFNDLLIVLDAWGPCPPECDDPGTCDQGFPECDGEDCLCFMVFEGGGHCLDPSTTCNAPECPGGSGDCPPGWMCYVETCCDVPTCAPPEAQCGGGAAPDNAVPAIAATFGGVKE